MRLSLKNLLAVVGVVMATYGLIVGTIHFFQDNFIFIPKDLSEDYAFPHLSNADELEIPLEIDDNTINALHFEGEETAKGVVIYFHGNSSNLRRWGHFANDFTERDWDVLMIDYPGYGKSEGEPSEKAFYSAADAAYCWAYDNYADCRIVAYGRSIGTPVAAYTASRYEIDQLILECPFYSMEDPFRDKVPWIMYPLEPSVKFPTNQYLAETDEPTMIFHGTSDYVVPYESGLKLKTYLDDPNHFVTIEGGRHNGLNRSKVYQEKLTEFLE
jgi:alpha-beta hydrolase superfamily lysophospholipase